jgi:Uma2 family endonuclease
MSVVTTPPFGIPPFPIRKFTLTEYHRMIQAGILTEDDAVELLEGWIVPKMPRKPPHDGTIQIVNNRLRRVLPPGWDIRVQSAITVGDSEPEPDLAVVRGDERSYLQRHPGPTDVGAAMEVADTSLTQDRDDKGRILARARIPVYWIINLIDQQIEDYTDPSGPTANPCYRNRTDYGLQDSIPFVLDFQEIARIPVRELLP